MSELAAVEETAVWLEVNGRPAVTWMCTPELLEELAVGWLHGEGYIDRVEEVQLRPCATDLGFWAQVPPERVAIVQAEGRRPVLASGCGAVSTFLAEPTTVEGSPLRGLPPPPDQLRALFKALFAQGERYKDTGGIHAAALVEPAEAAVDAATRLVAHAEDIGRHNAVDKSIGGALLAGRKVAGLGLLVTGRISAELAFKAARAGIAWVATPSVPSTLAVEIARRSGMVLVGRAVSGAPQMHGAAGPETHDHREPGAVMRIRDLAAAAALLASPATAAVAQKTGDQSRIIFTISGAYIGGRGLWSVPNQPVQDPPLVDTFNLNRSIQSNFGAGFSGAYFPGSNLGITADFLLLGLGYDDTCGIVNDPESLRNLEVCDDITDQDKSAAAVTVAVGVNYRFASRDFISPFVRANVGVLFANQSSILTQGVTNDGVLLTIYEDEKRESVTPAFALGLGATMQISRGYHLRWEVRDNIVGIDAVTGPTSQPRFVPPHEQVYKHMFSVLIGIDVILERDRGRRY